MLSCENLGDVRLQGRLVLAVHLRQHQASIHLGVLGLSNPQLFQVMAPVRRHLQPLSGIRVLAEQVSGSGKLVTLVLV